MTEHDIYTQILHLINHEEPQWMIVRQLHEAFADDPRLNFCLFDDWRDGRLPFDRHQGYVKLTTACNDSMERIIRELCNEAEKDIWAVANLWIFINRIDGTDDESNGYQTLFRSLVPYGKRHKAFNKIVESVRKDAYRYVPDRNDMPTTIRGWQRFTMYAHSQETDFAYSIASLIVDDNEIGLQDLFKLPPYVIGALVGFRGYRLQLTAEEALTITDNAQVAFLAERMLNGGLNAPLADWMTSELVHQLMADRAETVGLDLLQQAWFYNPQQTEFSQRELLIRKMTRQVVTDILSSDNNQTESWIEALDLMDHLPLILQFMSQDTGCISDEVKKKIGRAIPDKLQVEIARFSTALTQEHCPIRLSGTKMNTPTAPAVGRMAAETILLVWPETEKLWTKILYAVKELYLGGWHACRFATGFTEMLLIIILHADIKDNKDEKRLLQLIEKINQTILTPYVHLTERTEAIWDDEFNPSPYSEDIGKILINNRLCESLKAKNDYARHVAKSLSNSIHQTSTTPWPFERA